MGIDDYMVKPIDLDELLLRIGALLRRAKIAVSKKLTVGNLILNAEAVSYTHLDVYKRQLYNCKRRNGRYYGIF